MDRPTRKVKRQISLTVPLVRLKNISGQIPMVYTGKKCYNIDYFSKNSEFYKLETEKSMKLSHICQIKRRMYEIMLPVNIYLLGLGLFCQRSLLHLYVAFSNILKKLQIFISILKLFIPCLMRHGSAQFTLSMSIKISST